MNSADGSTVIGRSITIQGELTGSEDLFMDGTIDGSIKLPESRLTIGPNGKIKANLTARDIIIFGQVNGNVIATGTVDLRQSASLKGDITAAKLAIEENATIQGRADLTQGAPRAGGPGAPLPPIGQQAKS